MRTRVVTFLVVGVALVCGLVQCRGGSTSAQAETTKVVARLATADGVPFGGVFAVLDARDRSVLMSGSTDNQGDVSVTVPGEPRPLILVAVSSGMVSNTLDRWYTINEQYDAPPSMMERPPDWRWGFSPEVAHDPVDALDHVAIGDSRTFVTKRRKRVVDVSIRSGDPGAGGVVDFGEVRFPVVRPSLEIIVRLVGEDGAPFDEPVVLEGFRGDTHTPSGNLVYPHLALSQRGNVVRIPVTRAARRLLLADPESFVVLGSWKREFAPFRVPLDDEQYRLLELGAASVTVTVTVRRSSVGDAPQDGRPAPEEPRFWNLGEQGF